MSNFKTQMDEAAYKAMCKTNPGVIEALRWALRNGRTAKQIETKFRRKYGDGNLTAMSAVCAAYYLEAHLDLLKGEHDA